VETLGDFSKQAVGKGLDLLRTLGRKTSFIMDKTCYMIPVSLPECGYVRDACAVILIGDIPFRGNTRSDPVDNLDILGKKGT